MTEQRGVLGEWEAAVSVRESASPLSPSWVIWAQWLALASMMVDHIAVYLFPGSTATPWLSDTVGRLAFPLFAGMMAWHVVHYTRSFRRYMWRVLMIGVVAQMLYMGFPAYPVYTFLNVCFTLALGLMLFGCVERLRQPQQQVSKAGQDIRNKLHAAISVLGIGLASVFVEFGPSGVLLVPAFIFAFRNYGGSGWRSQASASCLLLVAATLNVSILAMGVTVVSTAAVLLSAGRVKQRPVIQVPRWLWRVWYPAHFGVLLALVSFTSLGM